MVEKVKPVSIFHFDLNLKLSQIKIKPEAIRIINKMFVINRHFKYIETIKNFCINNLTKTPRFSMYNTTYNYNNT